MPPTTSVCMATYNGAPYVAEQIASILAQLGPDDEVIVVDDASTDTTADVVREVGDARVQLHLNDTNVGYVATFERALGLAQGELVFLADQDDVWPPGRLSTMSAALREGAGVVAGNLAVLGGEDRIRGPLGERDWRIHASASRHTVRNLLRMAAADAPYFGSAMGVRREVLERALPFPGSVRELHDVWLALIGLFSRSLVHVDDRVVLRREHSGNATGSIRSPRLVLRGRLYFLGMCLAAWRRTRGFRRARGHPRG